MSSVKHHPSLSPLSWIFGKWESVEAVMSYPTVETVKYYELVEFKPTDSDSFMDYNSETWHLAKKSKLHCEKGFLRIDPESKKLALIMSHHFGLSEISEGTVENQTIHFESKSLSQASFIDVVATLKIVRKWELKDGELHSTVFLQTANQPLQLHLKSRYKRKD